jgi:hypothetical protein
LVQRPGDRIVARELAEHERDEEHPDHRDEQQPEVGRTARADAEHEQRVDADHRRQVGERDREVREQPEHAVELRPVAEAGQPRVVFGGRGSARLPDGSGCVHPSPPLSGEAG